MARSRAKAKTEAEPQPGRVDPIADLLKRQTQILERMKAPNLREYSSSSFSDDALAEWNRFGPEHELNRSLIRELEIREDFVQLEAGARNRRAPLYGQPSRRNATGRTR